MKALTIKQPWAQLIMHAGKDIENRQWYTSVRGRIAVTASAKLNKHELHDACDFMRGWMPRFSERIFSAEAQGYPVGCILGTVEIVGCVKHSESPWFVGDYGFLLRKPMVLKSPIPVKGALGFWDLPADLAAEVNRQLGELKP